MEQYISQFNTFETFPGKEQRAESTSTGQTEIAEYLRELDDGC